MGPEPGNGSSHYTLGVPREEIDSAGAKKRRDLTASSLPLREIMHAPEVLTRICVYTCVFASSSRDSARVLAESRPRLMPCGDIPS